MVKDFVMIFNVLMDINLINKKKFVEKTVIQKIVKYANIVENVMPVQMAMDQILQIYPINVGNVIKIVNLIKIVIIQVQANVTKEIVQKAMPVIPQINVQPVPKLIIQAVVLVYS